MTQLDMFPTSVHLRCIVPTENKRRFYSMSVQPTLFGDWILIKEWGRVGRPGRIRHEHHATIGEALTSLDKVERQKRRRGYAEH